MIRNSFMPQGFPGLLGGQQQQGLLGPMNTQNLMQQYLQQLFMRRYQTPMLQQQPGMVSSQMGPGGMQYMAPKIMPAANNPVQQQQQQQAQQAPGMTPYGMVPGVMWNPTDGQYSG